MVMFHNTAILAFLCMSYVLAENAPSYGSPYDDRPQNFWKLSDISFSGHTTNITNAPSHFTLYRTFGVGRWNNSRNDEFARFVHPLLTDPQEWTKSPVGVNCSWNNAEAQADHKDAQPWRFCVSYSNMPEGEQMVPDVPRSRLRWRVRTALPWEGCRNFMKRSGHVGERTEKLWIIEVVQAIPLQLQAKAVKNDVNTRVFVAKVLVKQYMLDILADMKRGIYAHGEDFASRNVETKQLVMSTAEFEKKYGSWDV
ncbi:hypothetical protein BT63DRAFT_457063 [Microthyrium microscopicum]|uniref:Uncharacterized protein n=1 Tax=Microthyrium microscopicum TaxID=703497 RepID=A0A6A6U836_9PEZI|nr:hypothetical protein BT63DRAFT_457063 [Microthyrium microscopicum]